MGSIPDRTCIGCRRSVSSSDLVRLAAPDGRVVVATRRGGSAMPRQGRGAWLHATPECVTAAVQKRAFGRAFRGGVDAPDQAKLLADVRLAMGASSPEQGKSI